MASWPEPRSDRIAHGRNELDLETKLPLEGQLDRPIEVPNFFQTSARAGSFAPLAFQLKVVTHERLKDTDGNLIQSVVALALTDEGLRDMSDPRRPVINLIN